MSGSGKIFESPNGRDLRSSRTGGKEKTIQDKSVLFLARKQFTGTSASRGEIQFGAPFVRNFSLGWAHIFFSPVIWVVE